MSQIEPDIQNQEAYENLIVTIEAKQQSMSLLIAVGDDLKERDRIITQYEAELQSDFRPYRVTLARGEPSLKAALAQLVETEEYLRQGGKAVLTVTGIEQLYFLKLGSERSEQEIFFGYLQWTREAIREFPYPIVIWVTNQILVELIKKAPDFWSWRSGVFRFASKTPDTPITETRFIPSPPTRQNLQQASRQNDPYFLPVEDLQHFVQQQEQQGANPSLATFYVSLGNIYQRRLDRGESKDSRTDTEQAIAYFSKAAELQKQLGLKTDLTTTLNYLAQLYCDRGRYEDAEVLFQQVLELTKHLHSNNDLDVVDSLNNLAQFYCDRGRYSEAEPLYIQALELTTASWGDHPNFAQSLNNLAGLYSAQGHYHEAETLYLQALQIYRNAEGDNHPDVATNLNNLALLYKSQERYSEAEPLLQQALIICEQKLGACCRLTISIRKNLENLR